ncbi:parathyroid hormone 4 [Antennarius striatus]|uniref:parathyroid hormone 4 n=1 Tax=Antennarius striatus TaxID=241820 RepID=UPI0035AFEC7A
MQWFHRPLRVLAVMLLVVVTSSRCQQNESRRAVTEHQLLHDRGKNIQSLRRLIWLSGAIEGLHTAKTRSADFKPTKIWKQALNPGPGYPAGSSEPNQVQQLLRDFFKSYLDQLDDIEP